MKHVHGRLAISAPLIVSGFMLAGCVGSPTYGTGTPAAEQLLSDVTGVLQIAPDKKAPIDYKPRPELVRPAKGSMAVLPEPQQSVANSDNPSWPESPEQLRGRIRAEATANRDNPGYVSPIAGNETHSSGSRWTRIFGERGKARETPVTHPMESGSYDLTYGKGNKQREEFNKRLAERGQGNATTRKYLSEPPVAYRQPAVSAPAGDVGEDEWRKEQRQKSGGKKGWSLRNLLPGS